jgi:hypothetical protein
MCRLLAYSFVRPLIQVGSDERPARRPGLLHRVAVALSRGKTQR